MSLFEAIFGRGFLDTPIPNQPPPKPTPPSVPPDDIKRVTIAQLVERKDSLVRINGKVYRVRVTEVELTR